MNGILNNCCESSSCRGVESARTKIILWKILPSEKALAPSNAAKFFSTSKSNLLHPFPSSYTHLPINHSATRAPGLPSYRRLEIGLPPSSTLSPPSLIHTKQSCSALLHPAPARRRRLVPYVDMDTSRCGMRTRSVFHLLNSRRGRPDT